MSDVTAAVAGAWQAALAAEQQAVYGYGLLGPHLTGGDRHRAIASSAAHEDIRDATETALAAVGTTPVGPRADYPALYPVPDAAAARRLAVRLEQDAAAAWRFLYATAAGSSATDTTAQRARADAQRHLTASAVRAASWQAAIDPKRATTAFPGI